MKKLMIFMIMIVSLFMTACDNEEKAKETTTTTTSVEERGKNTLPCMFIYNGILHTHITDTLYDSFFDSADVEKTALEGFVSIGEIVGHVSMEEKPVGEMHANFLKEGTTIYYNEEKDMYAFYTNMQGKIFGHTCNEDCKKVTD
ncbi:MAG: hypothetical protein IJX42_06110 [Oscillospiraceae bacterium]|nr:hypothetical protein [Oscillospiraceae bacterium]